MGYIHPILLGGTGEIPQNRRAILGGISVGSRVGRVATHGAAATRRVIAAGGDEAGIEVDQVAVCSRGAPQNQGNAMGVVAD